MRKNRPIILLILIFIISTGFKPIKVKKEARVYDEQLEQEMTEAVNKTWAGSWYGAGSGARAYFGSYNNTYISLSESYKLEKVEDDWVPFFIDSVPGAGDSLLMKFYHKGPFTGAWVWLDLNNLWGRILDVSKCDSFMFYIKGDPGGEYFDFQIFDGAGNSTKAMGIDLFVPGKTVTSKWKRVVIPFSMISGIEGLDLTKVSSFGLNIVGDKGEHKLFLDNMVFIPNGGKMIDKKTADYARAVADPDKFLDRVILYDFNQNIYGVVVMEGLKDDSALKSLKHRPINETKIKPEHRKGHGKGVLELNWDVKANGDINNNLQITKKADWSKVYFYEYEVYVPEGAPAFNVYPWLMSDNWKWSQAAGVTAEPGQWVKMRANLDAMANVTKHQIDAFGPGFWGEVKSAYIGPVYIDNIAILGPDIKEYKPIFLPLAKYKKTKMEFTTIDLKKQVNMGFKDDKAGDGKGGWIDQGENDMRSFSAKGRTEYLGIPFDIIDPAKNKGKSSVVLRGQDNEAFPVKVEVDINRKCAGIYFLHSSAFSEGIIGKYTLEFEDGKKVSINIRDKQEIFNWWGEFESEMARPVWSGSNPMTGLYNMKVSLYLYALANPRPNEKIRRIIIRTDGNKSYLMVVAMTLTDEGPYLPVLETK